MKFILGQKQEMTQKFAEDGTVVPVTKVLAGPCVITQVKKSAKDNYTAVQVGYGQKKKLSKTVKGHLKNLGNFRYLKEFRLTDEEQQKLKVGDKIIVNTFEPDDLVKVTGISKGKGFQGVVKRHGFSGAPASHGHKDQLRMPGSIGATGPAHVFKGKKMPGRMGGSQVTVTNLKIVSTDAEKGEIFIKGAIPGRRGTLILISGPGETIVDSNVKEAAKMPVKEDKKSESQQSAISKISGQEKKEDKPVEKKVAKPEVKKDLSDEASAKSEDK